MGSLKRDHVCVRTAGERGHPVRRVVSEKVCGSPLMRLVYARPDGLLPRSPFFLLWMRTITLLHRWLSIT
jgi:hypothetical protein